MELVSVLLEVIKYTVPALVVYYLMSHFIKNQGAIEQMKLRASMSADTLSLRLQAYERLILFVERIGLVDAQLRLDKTSMTAHQLSTALMVAIQKEYEHNLTQQIYVSPQLWEMISLLKDETIAAVSQAESLANMEDKPDLKQQLFVMNDRIDASFTKKVRAAINKEVELFFK